MGLYRLILAISVVVAHSAPIRGLALLAPQTAVQAFFVVSGFYMSLVLNEKYVARSGSYWLFISNRFLRLFPLYWGVLTLTVFVNGLFALVSNGQHLGVFRVWLEQAPAMHPLVVVYLVLSNIAIFGQDVALFLGFDETTRSIIANVGTFSSTQHSLNAFELVPQAWSMALECAFYLVAPFLVRRRVREVVAMIAFIAVVRFALSRAGLAYDPWTHRFFPLELGTFLLGNVSYRIYARIKTRPPQVATSALLLASLVVWTALFGYVPIPFKTELYLVLLVVALPFVFHFTSASRFDRYVGDLSYPVYLCHLLAIDGARTLHLPAVGGEGLLATICSIAISIGLNALVTDRVERLRQRRAHSLWPAGMEPRRALGSATTSAVLVPPPAASPFFARQIPATTDDRGVDQSPDDQLIQGRQT